MSFGYRVLGFGSGVAGGGLGESTGGDSIDTYGAYSAHTFLRNGTFTPSGVGTVDFLIVAGGGGGGYGNNAGGAGGAGGLITGTGLAVTVQGYDAVW